MFSGIFEYFRRWMLSYTPPDKRILLIVIGYCFGALLEGGNDCHESGAYICLFVRYETLLMHLCKYLFLVAGFGTPGAICSSLLVSLG